MISRACIPRFYQVMLFMNSVGEIVHQSCHDNRGEPNKNIGDAFLIVWRPRSLGDHTKICDGALTASEAAAGASSTAGSATGAALESAAGAAPRAAP